MKKSTLTHSIRSIPFLDQNFFTPFSTYMTILKSVKNSIIIKKDKPSAELFMIIKGSVELREEGKNGKVETEILREGDFFGIRSVVFSVPINIEVRSISDSLLYRMSKTNFYVILEEHPELSFILLQKFIRRKCLLTGENEYAVAEKILQLIDDFGMIKNGTVKINKSDFQMHLFPMIASNREYLFRTLHFYAKKGLIVLDGTRLPVIDYQNFRNLFN